MKAPPGMEDGMSSKVVDATSGESSNPWVDRRGLALLTDFYELTMGAGFFKTGKAEDESCFEYFFRGLPEHNGVGVFCGIQSVLKYLTHFRFTEDDIYTLERTKMFTGEYLNYLKNMELKLTVRAAKEGTLVFPGEPLVQVSGPLIQCQLIESALLNFLNFQTLIATKAARMVRAANHEMVLDMGLRRAQGPDGALSSSRAQYIGGCSSTSNTLAHKYFGIPVKGTMAHSWVMIFDTEIESFRAYADTFPESCALLVDTYDTIRSGVPNAITVFKELAKHNPMIRPAIRLDSGDLAKLSKQAHQMFVDAGFKDPLIVASNDLDEHLIADLKRQGAKINAWGVGTKLTTAYDQPALGGVYKLVAVKEGETWAPKIKVSSNIDKITNPGRHDVVRFLDETDSPIGDVIYEQGEAKNVAGVGTVVVTDATNLWKEVKIRGAHKRVNLLDDVFVNGSTVNVDTRTIAQIRTDVILHLDRLDDEFKRLLNPEYYKVALSTGLGETKKRLLQEAQDMEG